MTAIRDTLLSNVPPVNMSNGGDDDSEPTKITVKITPRSVAALDYVAAARELTKTDALNRALQLYGEIERFLAAGGMLYMREPGSKELERIRIL